MGIDQNLLYNFNQFHAIPLQKKFSTLKTVQNLKNDPNLALGRANADMAPSCARA